MAPLSIGELKEEVMAKGAAAKNRVLKIIMEMLFTLLTFSMKKFHFMSTIFIVQISTKVKIFIKKPIYKYRES